MQISLTRFWRHWKKSALRNSEEAEVSDRSSDACQETTVEILETRYSDEISQNVKTSFWSSFEGHEDRSSDERPHLKHLKRANVQNAEVLTDEVLKTETLKFWWKKIWRLKTIDGNCHGQNIWWSKSWRPNALKENAKPLMIKVLKITWPRFWRTEVLKSVFNGLDSEDQSHKGTL